MAVISPVPKLQFFDANGNPLAGGKLYSYAAGTTTPQATYTDAGGGTPNTNPVILDSRGEASVWLGSSAYKLKLTTATDVEIWTVDNVAGAATLAQLAASGGSALIGFLQAGTGAVERTAQAKMRDVVSVKDFGAVGNGVADDAAAINAALTHLAAIGGGNLYFPNGTYTYATSPNFARTKVNILCDRGTLFKHTGSGNAFIIDGGATGVGLNGLTFKNVVVEGNANSTNGIYVRTIARSLFDCCRVRGCATTGAAIRIDFGVCNTWINPTVSTNEGAFSSWPLYGMLQTNRAPSVADATTTQTLINPVFEGLTNVGGAGIYIDYAGGCQSFGGTSEANTDGVVITANSYGLNQFYGMHLEGNSGYDFKISANYNSFYNNYSMGAPNGILFTNNANRNVWVLGQIDKITLDNTTSYNTFYNALIVTSRTDNSLVGSRNEWMNCTGPGGFAINAGFRSGLASPSNALSYSASMTPDLNYGNTQIINASNGSAFTINAPINAIRGQQMTIEINNISGGALGTVTWNAVYRFAGGVAPTSPANAYGRAITFWYNGLVWHEVSRVGGDVLS